MSFRTTVHTHGDKVKVTTLPHPHFCTLNISMNAGDNEVVFFFPIECYSHMQKIAELWNNPVKDSHDTDPGLPTTL